jgi:putative transposase
MVRISHLQRLPTSFPVYSGHNLVTASPAKAAIFEYIEIFYNRQRLHQTLDYLSPAEFEHRAGVS